MKLAVLIPVFNEEGLLRAAIARLDDGSAASEPFKGESLGRRLVLVDDGSTDGTWKILEELRARPDVIAVRHEENRGRVRR
jgi:glycosyltransferase involved in cell wall biosynthesis